ncbi:MAG: glucosaminidase domain-containing protein [Bacteroidales bacterium]|nr:glucosaminidase domain-containing protein [Bacteroidales bacterium]
MRKVTIILILIGFSTVSLHAQRMTREEYIEKYKDIAIEKMQEFRIPASITLAQGILESGSGNSKLARRANNHFGIKCHNDWKGKTFRQDDDARRECFRKYKKVEDSFRDHSYFLTQRGRYSDLFKLDITDYKGWARGLKKAGYATNPKYPQLLIKIIEDHKLYQYDKDLPIASKSKIDKPEIVQNNRRVFLPGNTNLEVVETSETDRKVYENNRRKFILARKGDDFWKIADEFGIYTWQVYKYNELDKDDTLVEGQMLYLEKKRNRAEEEYHIVKENENMYIISQIHGIKLKKLYKRNDMEEGSQPRIGQRLVLR